MAIKMAWERVQIFFFKIKNMSISWVALLHFINTKMYFWCLWTTIEVIKNNVYTIQALFVTKPLHYHTSSSCWCNMKHADINRSAIFHSFQEQSISWSRWTVAHRLQLTDCSWKLWMIAIYIGCLYSTLCKDNWNCPLLSSRSRQRERLHATGLSICSSVCLSVCRQNTKTRFSQKLSNLEPWSLLSTYRKSYIIGPLKSKMAEIRHLEYRHNVIFSAEGGPIWIKFRRLV